MELADEHIVVRKGSASGPKIVVPVIGEVTVEDISKYPFFSLIFSKCFIISLVKLRFDA